MMYYLGSRGGWQPPSISCMSGYKDPYRTGGHPMVPNITTMLQRFTGEWGTLLQPEAILALCREIG